MFSIEHDFDATVVTLVDDTADAPLREDITISAFEECITLTQWDPREDKVHTITLSIAQLEDLRAALSLPEGVYQRQDAP